MAGRGLDQREPGRGRQHHLQVDRRRQLPDPRIHHEDPGPAGSQRHAADRLGRVKHQFKTWIFDSEGGFGEGYWTRDGDRWLIKAEGVRQDGQPASATNIITRLGKDRIELAIGRPHAREAPRSRDQRVHRRAQATRGRQVRTCVFPSEHIPSLHSRTRFMTRIFSKLALGTALVILVSPSDVFAGRGGGAAAEAAVAAVTAVAVVRRRYRGGGGMGGSPSFSQPRQSTGQSGTHPQSGNGSGTATQPELSSSRGCRRRRRGLCQPQPELRLIPQVPPPPAQGYANRNQSLTHPALRAAAAGAGYANNNQSLNHPGAAGAAAGAGYANNHSGINGYLERQQLRRWGATGYGTGYGERGRGLGSRLADVWLGLFGLQQSLLRRLCRGGWRCADRGRAAARRRRAARATITPSRSARPPRRPIRPSPARQPRRSTRPATRSRRATTPRPCSSTSRRSRRRPMTGPCTSSSPWCSSLRASTTRPPSRSTRSSRSHPAGTGRP